MRAVRKLLRHRRLVALLCVCAAVGSGVALCCVARPLARWWRGADEDVSCHRRRLRGEILDTEDPRFAPPRARSVFFHETSCKGATATATLAPRQACAVESAALANPELVVHVLFSGPVAAEAPGDATLGALLQYGNVRLARLQLERYAAGSPLEEWLASGALNGSRHRVSHTSDVLRYLTLWRHGGVYLDLDVVVARPLRTLTANWAGRESRTAVAAGAVAFSWDDDGRRYANAAIRELRSSFRGDRWGHNGPGVITRVLERHCATKDVTRMTAERCGGFEVYSEEKFYPIPWRSWKQYFHPKMLSKVKSMNSTYIFHVWNKHSSKRKTHPNVEVPYTYLARRYCPKVYRVTRDHF